MREQVTHSAVTQEALTRDEVRSLPFGISVTPLKKPNPVPDYMGGPWSFDYPPCVVSMDGELWVIHGPAGNRIHRFKGTTIENAVEQPDGSHPPFPVNRPYMLGGMWYDEAEKKLYAPMHCETPGYPTTDNPAPSSPTINRQIHLATSTDKGLTWQYEGPLVTRDDPAKPHMAGSEFSGLWWDGGDGDFQLFVDRQGGYFYLFSNHYTFPKPGVTSGGWSAVGGFMRHRVARCAIRDKMAPGKWHKFYNGNWSEPGLGGRSSNVSGYYVMYNTYLKKYLSFDLQGYLSACTDLAKQDWSAPCKVGDIWMANDVWAAHITSTDKMDIANGGRTLYVYTYWGNKFGGAFQLDLGPGRTPSLETAHPFFDAYAFEPLFESADPVESRRTRRISAAHPEASYTGLWTDEANKIWYEQQAKTSATPGSSVELSFRGAAVYWRAVHAEDGGKADVFIDGRLEQTVDCYAATATPYLFGFIKTGLDPKQLHTIRIVVRADHDPRSKGTTIRHMVLEYAAESYRASDGFSSAQGKNGWYYLQWKGAISPLHHPLYTNMRFQHPNWVDVSDWNNPADGQCAIGHAMMTPNTGIDAVRAWVAPHGGTIRVEGRVALAQSGGDGVNAAILRHRAPDLWPPRQVRFGQPVSHDVTVDVVQGDVLYFVVSKISAVADSAKDRADWDPVVTYIP
jgi:hypothetical protein